MRAAAFVTALLAATAQTVSAIPWGNTKYLMMLGDSYSSVGYNISAGINSPVPPNQTFSNGWTWVQYLTETFNIAPMKVYNLAFGGATTSKKLVTPYAPFVINFDQQTQLFLQYLSPPPAEAPWSGNNTLFAIWIGINDIAFSWNWTNVTQSAFHSTIMDTYFEQLRLLYTAGARSFLLLTVPPMERSPYFYAQGASVTRQVSELIKDYNKQLKQRAKQFTAMNRGVEMTVYDTSKVFNTLLDNADDLGFVNATGYAEPYAPYAFGAPERPPQVPGYPPVSSYFWLDFFHPLYTVHFSLAHAISTVLST